ncbi:hypothetical protein EMIT0P2_10905 [Pseudomonas sp. IT-P2]
MVNEVLNYEFISLDFSQYTDTISHY